jgi:hypothetical protein
MGMQTWPTSPGIWRSFVKKFADKYRGQRVEAIQRECGGLAGQTREQISPRISCPAALGEGVRRVDCKLRSEHSNL